MNLSRHNFYFVWWSQGGPGPLGHAEGSVYNHVELTASWVTGQHYAHGLACALWQSSSPRIIPLAPQFPALCNGQASRFPLGMEEVSCGTVSAPSGLTVPDHCTKAAGQTLSPCTGFDGAPAAGSRGQESWRPNSILSLALLFVKAQQSTFNPFLLGMSVEKCARVYPGEGGDATSKPNCVQSLGGWPARCRKRPDKHSQSLPQGL